MKYDNFKIKEMPQAVRKIIDIYDEMGYHAYLVGGCVRDCLMGITPKDIDICTDALPSVAETVKNAINESFVNNVCKIIPTGEKFGTITFNLFDENYEVTTFREDGRYEDGRHPQSVVFSKKLEDDLSRRDFTINAIACDGDGNIVDYFNGISDIRDGIIRCVGNPEDRFNEDALRMLRCIRFASRYGFKIEENTAKAIIKLAPNIKYVSKERIGKELSEIIENGFSDRLMDVDVKCLEAILTNIPEINKEGLSDLYKKGTYSSIYKYIILFAKDSTGDTLKCLNKFAFGKNIVNPVINVIKGIPYLRCNSVFNRVLSLRYCQTDVEKYTIVQLCEDDFMRKFLIEYIRNNYPVNISELKIDGNMIKSLLKIKEGKEIGDIIEDLLMYVIKNPQNNNFPCLCNEVISKYLY